MDIFVEKLVKRRCGGREFAAAIGVIILTILLSFAVVLYRDVFFGLWFVVIAGLVFGCYWLISGQSAEFEYSLTNNELDVDKIIARRKRKRIITINARQIEILAPTSNEQYSRAVGSKTEVKIHDCSGGKNAVNAYFIIFFDKSGQKNLLIFEPNEKMLAGFKRYSPNKVVDK